jgi:hypothetical protein
MYEGKIVFYLCFAAIAVVASIFTAVQSDDQQMNIVYSNFELGSIIAVFMTSLFAYKESFRFSTANGISRRSHFAATLLAIGILSVVFSLIDTMISSISIAFSSYRPLYLEIFGSRYGVADWPAKLTSNFPNIVQIQLENFLWSIFFHLFFAILAFFITVIFYRLNKVLKIVLIVSPSFLLNGISAFDIYVCNGKIGAFFAWLIPYVFGNSTYNNPYLSILRIFAITVLFAAIAWMFARKSIVKKS